MGVQGRPPLSWLCWPIDDVRPDRRDAQGNKTDRQRLWQVLTMWEGKIVRIQDYTDQASALHSGGLATGP